MKITLRSPQNWNQIKVKVVRARVECSPYGDNQTIILLHGSKAPEEGNEEDDGSDDDQKGRQCEELCVEKVLVAMINALHRQADR